MSGSDAQSDTSAQHQVTPRAARGPHGTRTHARHRRPAPTRSEVGRMDVATSSKDSAAVKHVSQFLVRRGTA